MRPSVGWSEAVGPLEGVAALLRWCLGSLVCLLSVFAEVLPDFGAAAAVRELVEVVGHEYALLGKSGMLEGIVTPDAVHSTAVASGSTLASKLQSPSVPSSGRFAQL